jgi:CBS-domain-containing membrane protein
MKRVEELMNKPPITCEPDYTLSEAAQRMWRGDCGCLPVTAADESRRLVGIITDRDICMAARFPGKSLHNLRVGDAMTKTVRYCNPEDSFVEAEAIMQEARVRRLPVVNESEQVVGVISLADLAREAVREGGSEMTKITKAEIGKMLATLSEPHHIGEDAVDMETTPLVGW